MADEIYGCFGGLDCVDATALVTETTNFVVSGFSFITLLCGSSNQSFSVPLQDQDTGEAVSLTQLWSHFTRTRNDGSNNVSSVEWRDNTGKAIIRLLGVTTPNIWSSQLQYLVGSTWTNVAGAVSQEGYQNTHDFDFFFDLSETGKIALFMDNVEIAELTGDLSAIGSISSVWFSYVGSNAWYQQGIFSNFNTIGHTVRARKVIAAGANQEWNGPYGNVSSYPMDDSKFITANVADELNTYEGTVLSATPTGQKIRGVVLGLYIRRDASGPQNAKGVLDISGTEYDAAYNMRAIGLGFNGNIAIWADNPATSEPWANITEANCDFGAKSVA